MIDVEGTCASAGPLLTRTRCGWSYAVAVVGPDQPWDRLARFGSEYTEAALAAPARRLLVMEPDEVKDDLVRDVTGALTSFCARLHRPPSGSTWMRAAPSVGTPRMCRCAGTRTVAATAPRT
jgi:hypothetical protein